MKINQLFARRIFDEDDSIINEDTKSATLEPAGSRPGDALIIASLMKMGLSRAEARAHINTQRGYGV